MGSAEARAAHAAIWTALDDLAEQTGKSPCGLATAAGLAPTSFNPSKRIGANGRRRWPSTETITAVLAVTDTSYEEFEALVDRIRATQRMPPVWLPRRYEYGMAL